MLPMLDTTPEFQQHDKVSATIESDLIGFGAAFGVGAVWGGLPGQVTGGIYALGFDDPITDMLFDWHYDNPAKMGGVEYSTSSPDVWRDEWDVMKGGKWISR